MPSNSPLTQDSASALSESQQRHLDQVNASRSQRQMRLDRGYHTIAIGERRLFRNKQRAFKASNRYCNNIGSDGSIVYT